MSIPVTPNQILVDGAPEPFTVKAPAPAAGHLQAEKRSVTQMLTAQGAEVTLGGEKYILPNKSIAKAEHWRSRFRQEMPEMFKAWLEQDEKSGVEATMSFMDGTFIRKAARLIAEWDPRLSGDWIEENATVEEVLYSFLQIWAMINPFGPRNGKITKQILGMEM